MLLIVFFTCLRGVFADCNCTTGTIAATRTSLTLADNHVRALLTTTSFQGIPLQQIGCVTIDTPSFLKQKVELEVKKSDSWSIALASNCSISSFLASASYEDSELLVTVVGIKSSAASKVGVAKLSVFASLAFGLVAGSQQPYCNKPVPVPIAAAMLGLAQGAVAQSEAECRYIIQVTTPHPCFTAYNGNTDLHCSFGAKLVDCPVTAVSSSRSPMSATGSVSQTRSTSQTRTPSASLSPVSASPTASVSQAPSASLSPVSASASGSISESPSETSSTSLTPSVSSTVTPSASSTTSRSPSTSASFSTSASASSTCCPNPNPSPSPEYFITTWNMTAWETLTFPLTSTGTYDFQVNWGDGSSSYCNTSTCSHQYRSVGSAWKLYNVSAFGLLKGFSFRNTYSTMAKKLVDVPHWGGVCLGDGGHQFREIKLTRWTASDVPCTSQVTDMELMFYYTPKFNQNLSDWNTSSVTNMKFMFLSAYEFNQPLNTWDTSSVIDMQGMFNDAFKFNQDLSDWDTSSVTNMQSMFKRAYIFNQPLITWDTSSVTDMRDMFYQAKKFDQPLNNWDTSSVIDMTGMFVETPFNQDLSNWNTSSVTNMQMMFYSSKFNQPLNTWDTSSVTNMGSMFQYYLAAQDYNAPYFNQNLSDWDTSSVTNMRFMFRGAWNFNQPLNTWDTSSVIDMQGMFNGAPKFNQDLSDWDTSSVTNMDSMFFAAPIRQNLTSWNTSQVTSCADFGSSSALCDPLVPQLGSCDFKASTPDTCT